MNTKTYKYPIDEDCTAVVRFEGEISAYAVEMLIEHLVLFAKIRREAETPSKAFIEATQELRSKKESESDRQ